MQRRPGATLDRRGVSERCKLPLASYRIPRLRSSATTAGTLTTECHMRLSPIPLPTSYGPALATPPRQRIPITLSHHEADLLIRAIAAEADAARAEGNIAVAERLDWRVADLREVAR